jgi:hypothetical protein
VQEEVVVVVEKEDDYEKERLHRGGIMTTKITIKDTIVTLLR